MTKKRENSIEINKAEFQKTGYQLIDTIAAFFDEISENQSQQQSLQKNYKKYWAICHSQKMAFLLKN